ncbi:ABC transporter substrate-binding protein [Janthinobacterium sp. J1-1]|uniref:ABC transporter substrate-binding protein n=1 Tax=Janthinobacterium sp. J1-1 TaxID=3065910 RepID=UPI002810CED1|nr:ABC transporter substrate-binding protein [Janthinobacterium sp. J1-1]
MTQAPFFKHRFVAAAVLAVICAPSLAAPIKVGLALDVSGPFSGPGQDARNGFALAIKQLGGKLGGQPAEFLQVDMAGNPDQARQLAERFIQKDKIDFFTGPSQYAGAKCSPYFFGTAYQNDQFHEAAGKFASDRGFRKIMLMAPNYPAGRDGLTGFKRAYGAPVADELYVKVGQLDFSTELAQLRADKPDALYYFLPGAMGINFVKQFVAAGLQKDIKLVSTGFSADEDVIGAVGAPMLGLYNTAHWAHDLDNAANRTFVAAYRKEFGGRAPSIYAAQAYDVILSIDAAVKAVKGNMADRPAIVAALEKADFASVRGPFKYANNHYPIENFYLRVVGKDDKGVISNKLSGTVLTAYGDAYAAQCPMPSIARGK